MKNISHQPNRSFLRIIIALLTVACLTMTVGCGKKEPWNPFKKETACERIGHTIEAQISDLKAGITGEQTSADRAALWQMVAALFIVLSAIALIGGAALGSRARKDSSLFSSQQSSGTPE